MSVDARGWRIALVADSLMNPAVHRPPLPDIFPLLDAAGYGLLQLPPPGPHRVLLAVMADQIAEYAHHGYAVVAVGVTGEPEAGLHWRRLALLLRQRTTPLPSRYLVGEGGDAAIAKQQLAAFLADHDLPPEEQRRWRV